MMLVRNIGAMFLGLLAALILIVVIQSIGQRVYPLPPGTDPRNIESLREVVPTLPAGAFGFVLLSYAVGTFAGVSVGMLVSRRNRRLGFVVGVVLLMMGIANLVRIPHPLWFGISCVALFVAVTVVTVFLFKPNVEPI